MSSSGDFGESANAIQRRKESFSAIGSRETGHLLAKISFNLGLKMDCGLKSRIQSYKFFKE